MCRNLFYSRARKRFTVARTSPAKKGRQDGESLKRGKVLVNNGNNDDGGGKVRALGTWLPRPKCTFSFSRATLDIFPWRMRIPRIIRVDENAHRVNF